MDGMTMQWGYLEEKGNKRDTYTQNQKATDEVSWRHNEEVGFTELDPHRTYQGQE